MRDKNQIFIYSDSELALIKAVFCDNEELLYAIRKMLLQFPMTDDERALVRQSMTPAVFSVLKKRMFPEITGDEPLSQLSDMYQTLNNDMNSKSEDDMESIFEAKQLEIDYLSQQFAVLKGEDVGQKIILDDMKVLGGRDSHEVYVKTKARNFLLAYVDSMLSLIKSIAGKKTETVDEAKERMSRNSTK